MNSNPRVSLFTWIVFMKYFCEIMCLVEKFKLNCSYLLISPCELIFGVIDGECA